MLNVFSFQSGGMIDSRPCCIAVKSVVLCPHSVEISIISFTSVKTAWIRALGLPFHQPLTLL